MQKIGLGTVQFGLNYGVSNTHGRVPISGVKDILDIAYKAGMDTLDTAIGYGDSEEVLGKTGVKSWRVISKLPSIPNGCNDISGWIDKQVQDSLARLDLNCLDGILMHDPNDLNGSNGKLIIKRLLSLKEENLVKKHKPHVLIVGSDWKNKTVVGEQHAQHVRFFDRIGEYATTKIIEWTKNQK